MLTHPSRRTSPVDRRGAALITSLITVTTLTAAAVGMLMTSVAVTQRTEATVTRTRALQLAEAGLAEALVEVGTSVSTGGSPAPSVGSSTAPLSKGTGVYWADIEDLGDGTFRATSTGRAGLHQRRLTSIFTPGRSVFSYSVFAGNTSGDPAYTIELGGSAGQADWVAGDVYSGGSVTVREDASIDGLIEVTNSIVGDTGNTGITRVAPDIMGVDYSTAADFNVATLFEGALPGTFGSSGTALQVSEDNPAHIFRLNPDDRSGLTDTTVKEDYFLEDPYEPINSFSLSGTGGVGHEISLSGILGEPGVSGTDVVYYVDGNLWLQNRRFLGARFRSDGVDAARVTFVARGNIYFSDDFELMDEVNDGVAFIAQSDPDVEDSGNIYFGDAAFGTINHMAAFMYAENNFFDNNLQGDASSVVTISGTMAAGNHVAIESDYVDETGTPQHSRLKVLEDDRLATGALTLPGIPSFGPGTLGFEIAFWQEISSQ